MPADRHVITIHHGEGSTVYYVIDTWASEQNQPAVVASWRAASGYDRRDEEGTGDLCREG